MIENIEVINNQLYIKSRGNYFQVDQKELASLASGIDKPYNVYIRDMTSTIINKMIYVPVMFEAPLKDDPRFGELVDMINNTLPEHLT